MPRYDNLDDAHLADEWHYWTEKINTHTYKVREVALKLQSDAEREIDRRGILLTGYNL